MDAKTSIKSRLPSRHVTDARGIGSTHAARTSATAHEAGTEALFDVAEIFEKNTECRGFETGPAVMSPKTRVEIVRAYRF